MIERARWWRMLVRVVAAAALVAAGLVMVPAAAHAVPGSITFPLNVTKSVIESQSPDTWCFWSQANCHHDYNAADIFAPTGTPVVSPVAGTVTSANHDESGVGSRVQIRDGDNDIWYLAHMDDSPGLQVEVGQSVQPGTVLGFVGTSDHANGTQPHLHIDMLPPPATSRPPCSGAECAAYPFYNVQPLLVAAYNAGGPAPPRPEMALQTNTGELWTLGWRESKDWNTGMRAGTSPSIAALPGGGYQVALQTNTGELWSLGNIEYKDWNAGMAPGTSPSICALAGGGYQIALQTNTGELWTLGHAEYKDWNAGMAPGTSPSITCLPGGGYEVAIQTNTGELWTLGHAEYKDWNAGMKAGTSPSIAALPGGGYEVAFQTNTGELWTLGNAEYKDWNAGMAPGTSPSICALAGGGYQVALQINTNKLWTLGNYEYKDFNAGMKAGTSPSITCLPGGGYEIALQINTGRLWTLGTFAYKDWGAGMAAGTSPAISS
jgi:Peptidase family M23